ncbi:MAG: hypothetical protein AAF494_07920 [Pseudomonadota bacterium]
MDTFLLTLLLVFASVLGARDQMLIAQLSDAFAQAKGRSSQLLFTGWFCAAASAAIMAYAGATIAELLPSRAAAMLVAFALGIAAFELAWPVRLKPLYEPTRSVGAAVAVLLAKQLGDAPRFIVFAFAAAAIHAPTALLGGALGGMAGITLGWWLGAAEMRKFPLYYLRLGLAACMIVAALFTGLNARFEVW